MQKGSALDYSPFLNQLVNAHPDWLDELKTDGRLERNSPPGIERLDNELHSHVLNAALRRFRNYEMLRIIWRDLNKLATLQETLSDLSTLAEICLQTSVESHTGALEEKHGVPRDENGQRQRLVVLGLGKLGGNELNLSSDIDIIFCFPEHGSCDGRGGLANEQFFTRLARKIIRSLADINADGFCFRVDTRLRPFGSSGPLVSSFAAMEQYYQREGRDWERYALIKARPVAGDSLSGGELLQTLKPFIYRRYIDFGAIESMREMHASVRADALRRDRADDIKRGPGGIREIEFLVQSFQLLRGGREPSLQNTSLCGAVNALKTLQLLSGEACANLLQAYEFLRLTENRIQALHDQQTHRVPRGEDGLRVANAMGFTRLSGFNEALDKTRGKVQTLFKQSLPGEPAPSADHKQWKAVWQRQLKSIHDSDGSAATGKPLSSFVQRLGRLSLSQRAARRLDVFMPLLLEKLAALQLHDAIKNRVFDLIGTICRRSAYLSLLVQNPQAIDRMLELFARSRRIADVVTRHPALLDELIDPSLGASPPTRDDIETGIRKLLAVHKDTETTLQNLNYLKQAMSLRIAVALLQSSISATRAREALSEMAQGLIQAVLELSRLDMHRRHGKLPGQELCVVAYGSLGAYALGFDSDLDLIFLYQPATVVSDGDRPLSTERYHTGTVRRLLSLLSALTPSGRLYTIDARLRPNGRSGLLLSGIQAFSRYQQEKAWVWELQALTRARAVAGDADIAQAFTRARLEALTEVRDEVQLKLEIASMRERIETQNKNPESLKFGHGGLLDIEFVTQLGLLSNAPAGQELFLTTRIPQQLEALVGCGWLSAHDGNILSDAHRRLNRARLIATLADDNKRRESSHLLEIARPVCDRLLRAIDMA